MICFTTASKKDLPKVRVLAKSIKRFHPNWPFYAVLTEPLGQIASSEKEAFSILQFDELGIEQVNSWIFMHNEIEARLAIKGPAVNYFFQNTKTDKLLYLDTSIFVFDSLERIVDLLDQYSICLVPQYTKPAAGVQQIIRQEITTLREGSFDLSFLALKKDDQGTSFANWWADRLFRYCYQNDQQAIFFDQKWCDLAPALFSRLYIIRDPCYNANVKNIGNRELSKSKENWLLDKQPIKLFRFMRLEKFGEPEICKSEIIRQLYERYEAELRTHDEDSSSSTNWRFNVFDNGEIITDEMRWIYRQRPDLRKTYQQPFETNSNKKSLYRFLVRQANQKKD